MLVKLGWPTQAVCLQTSEGSPVAAAATAIATAAIATTAAAIAAATTAAAGAL